jgi:nucleoside-diphosphate-sugar epimerase
VAEDSDRDPAGLYGLAHVAREKMLQYSTAKAATPLAILRPCAVYGPGDTHNGYGPNRFVRTALADGKIALFGGGEEQRDHIFVDDVCAMTIGCAMRRSTGDLIVATGHACSFADVANAVVRVVNAPVEIVPSPRKSPITHRHFDVTAAMKAFPSFACVTLDEGLRRSLQAVKTAAR